MAEARLPRTESTETSIVSRGDENVIRWPEGWQPKQPLEGEVVTKPLIVIDITIPAGMVDQIRALSEQIGAIKLPAVRRVMWYEKLDKNAIELGESDVRTIQ